MLEKFLDHHGISMISTARLAHYGRRFSAYFPSIADDVNPDRKAWTAPRISALVDIVSGIDPASVERSRDAREPKVAAKYKRQNRTQVFLNSREWKRLRYEILTERGARCELCGATGKLSTIHVDHIHPISKYWERRLEKTNLQVLCQNCNLGKGSWDETDHRRDSRLEPSVKWIEDEEVTKSRRTRSDFTKSWKGG